MEPLELFLSFLNKFVPLTTEEFKTLVVPYLEVRSFRKKQVVTPDGEVENYINFIVKGLVRKYYKSQETEIIISIFREDQVVHSLQSFYNRTPSAFVIDAIEPTTLLSINHENLEAIFSSNALMERLGRLVVTSMLVRNETWQMNLQKLSPRERFLEFVQNNSELMQRVPQKYLASLLNIQPETFSRFKHLLKGPPSVTSGE